MVAVGSQGASAICIQGSQPACKLIVYIMLRFCSYSSLCSISNLPKPTYTAESAVSDFYAFILAIHKHDYNGKLSMEINFKCNMPKLMKGATPNELIKRCDGRSDVNHWMKSTRASETITQKHSDAYRSSWGVTITTRLALKQSLSTTSFPHSTLPNRIYLLQRAYTYLS
ncbi:hypothetical protein T08_1659 [Trichinella sp. T8]|nr:hypothetical protein T08_1659 [Trichinella sp. T8]